MTAGWKIAEIDLPVAGYAGEYTFSRRTKVRTNGTDFQVWVDRGISKPYGDSPADYIAELTESCKDVIDGSLEFNEGNDEYSSDITLKGWRVANVVELTAMKENLTTETVWK